MKYKTLDIDRGLHREVKAEADRVGSKIRWLAEKYLREGLENQPKGVAQLKYNVNFCMTYTVDAKDEGEALDKATSVFVDDLPTFKAHDFGANVEMVKEIDKDKAHHDRPR